MNIYKHQDTNIIKTWALMLGFLVFVIGVGFVFSQVYGNSIILYIAVAISLVMNIGSYWFSDKIVLKMYKAKPVTRESHPDLWNVTENLSITAGLPMPKLYVIQDSSPNAFATGRNKEHAAVAVTSGLLDILDRSELEGVIAHELAHVGNRDILLSTVVVVLVGFIALLSDIFLRSLWFTGGNRDRNGWFLIIGIVLAILAPIAALMIQLAISRRREFLADASGALLTRYPEGLASALEKISSSRVPVDKASHATAHMFISSPFGKKSKKGLHHLFLTHPPAEERIRRLRGQ